MINKVIDASQSAFLEGRGLMDGVLVENEVLDERRGSKKVVFSLRWTTERLMTP